MADTKASALSVITDPQVDDKLYIVDNPGGTPSSKAITIGNIKQVRENAQSGTSYTLTLTDAGKLVSMNNASANTLTVPPNSSVAFPVGTVIAVMQKGAGVTTVSPGSGVTINSVNSADELADQYAVAGLYKLATNTWLLYGGIA